MTSILPSRERARRIIDAFVAEHENAIPFGSVMSTHAKDLIANAVVKLEIRISGEIDLAERAAWVAAMESIKTTPNTGEVPRSPDS